MALYRAETSSVNMIMRIICCMILVIDIEEGLAEKICSKGTDKTVKFCPQNERMWIKASKRKNCTQFMTKDCVDLQYHCVLNAYGNGTVEVCAKLTYLQGFCAEYNTLTNSIQNYYLLPCMNFTNGRCPSRYKSTEAYKYQECFKFLKRPNLNSNRTSKHYHLSHGQGSIDTAMIIILIVLSLCVSVCFMIYLVNYYHRSINE
ncbi:uncharacterized protein LOC134229852, partial [Saccostrea cucullata]|uniref:uncharacterized protein LOC134229852 n=1 Tax=Saccostrea cuccullata TaxID=36930 RepID=UPI002ED2920F